MDDKKYRLLTGVLLLVCCYLTLRGLDNTLFWDDEAQVGLMAKNLLSSGHLTGWDGRNLYGYRNGGALDENLRPVNAPLDILLCAASFKIFGISTLAARLPCALLGLLALPVLLAILNLEFKDENWLKFFIFSCFAFSCTYLLNIRQAVYYSSSLLFSLTTYYCYLRYRLNHQLAWLMGVVLTSTLSFYVNPLLCAAFLMSLFVCCLMLQLKDFNPEERSQLAVSTLLFLLLTAPYARYYKIWVRFDHVHEREDPWGVRTIKLLIWNYRDLNLINVLPWIFVPLMLYFLWRESKRLAKGEITQTSEDGPTRKILQWGALAFANIFFIVMLTPSPTFYEHPAEVRYLIVSFPFLASLSGWLMWMIWQANKGAAGLVFGIFISSNALTLLPSIYQFPWSYGFQWLLPAYVAEVHHPYPTSYNNAIQFLETHAAQDDSVFAVPEYFNYPLMFYMGHKLLFTSLLNSRPHGEDAQTHLDVERLGQLAPALFVEASYPQWLLCFGVRDQATQYVQYFSRPHRVNGKPEKFRYVVASVEKVYWDQTQRPELWAHSFGPAPLVDSRAGLWIMQRVDDADGAQSGPETMPPR